jgi:hypothetical protein
MSGTHDSTILREMSDENLREALERAYDDIVSGDGDDAADRYEELIQELNRRKVDDMFPETGKPPK